ncbi:MAG TPA: trigger factor [Chitinophagales bacterium]|nr:trigger factor [Chitinophagales bacterium]
MNISQNNTDNLNAIISIELKKEDYLPKVEKAITNAKNTATIKGFRKGHVPAAIIKKMYGNSILLDELNKVVSDALNNYIETEKLNLLGRPLPIPSADIQLDINTPADYTFEYEIGLAPQVKVTALSKQTKVAKEVVTIDDKTLDDEVEKLRERYGKILNPDRAEGEQPQFEKAELNQELFDKVYGPGVVTSVEEFKEKIRKELQDYAEKTAVNKLKESIYLSVMDSTEVSLPAAFLKKFIKASNEKPITEEQVESEYPQFEKGLKWNLITNAIAEEHGVKVEMEDVKNFSKEQLRAQFMMYGGGITDEMIEQFNTSMMSKDDHVRKSYEGALEQKLFDFIESKITIEDKSITFDELINKKEN